MLDPVPRTVGAVAAVLLTVSLTRLLWVSIRRVRLLRQLAAVTTAGAAGELVVFTSATPHAYAVAGRRHCPGRIVVSQAMLQLLSPEERRVMLAYERAHLRHGHHRFRAIAEAAAAANPLLHRLRDQLDFQVQRWADEDAADEVEDRRLAARSLARAALGATRLPAPGFAEYGVGVRVRALLAGPMPARPAATLPVLAVVVLGGAALVDAAQAFVHVLVALFGLR